jgi:glycerol-3-phosphate dehydrogenase (NAD(P)+)
LELSVLGSGRWGSFIAWYLNKIGHKVTLWGKNSSPEIKILLKERKNNSVSFEKKDVVITCDMNVGLNSEFIIISINSQNLRVFFNDLVNFCNNKKIDLNKKTFILCMKGIEESTGKRLTEIVFDFLPENNNIAVWVGPGHVKSLVGGIPTCMVIDSKNKNLKLKLSEIFSSKLIKCHIGNDLIGNEIGAAAKNVLGIGAGILDALNMEALKGPLMVAGAKEISILIENMGGKKESAFGLCHLGDYEATMFSRESNNRKFGESLVTKERVNFVAEGTGTSRAIERICSGKFKLPICHEIYNIISGNSTPKESVDRIFA